MSSFAARLPRLKLFCHTRGRIYLDILTPWTNPEIFQHCRRHCCKPHSTKYGTHGSNAFSGPSSPWRHSLRQVCHVAASVQGKPMSSEAISIWPCNCETRLGTFPSNYTSWTGAHRAASALFSTGSSHSNLRDSYDSRKRHEGARAGLGIPFRARAVLSMSLSVGRMLPFPP